MMPPVKVECIKSYEVLKYMASTQTAFNFKRFKREHHHLSMVEVVPQIGSNDCGLFSIAYAYELSCKRDPSNIQYDQVSMRRNFNNLVKTKFFCEFKSSVIDKPRNLIPLMI
ncbi:hypothetical protein BpHYR1_044209 [Brachionus plicatilis]|uniref:Ubiquitin-like protease family profile domain-containing protein n=1 Tax=Brachionus plicatilis TaxID=10195 RepID=A0A3M7TA92_BRAPC|nr:hypothetical protein BpHYR1_044209 [Brachionus plicatilis]